MTTFPKETIAAVATPPGKGGVGVIRVSGAKVAHVIRLVLGKSLHARKAHFLPFLDQDGTTIDSGLALFFPAPHSFTGEDVLELHAHGSPVVLDLLMRCILSLGVRMARPGEFSERAFLNDKIDLAQAEAIADLIEMMEVSRKGGVAFSPVPWRRAARRHRHRGGKWMESLGES